MCVHLNGSAGRGDVRFHSGGEISAREFLLLCLPSPDDGHCQKTLIHLGVKLEDLHDLLLSLGLLGEGCVALLPKELTGSEERLRVLKLPTLKEEKNIDGIEMN